MFKGLSGLKKVVKGGFSAVAETGSQLAEQVVSDPSTSQGHIKETLKAKAAGVLESGESVINKSEGTTQAIDKSVEFAHKVLSVPVLLSFQWVGDRSLNIHFSFSCLRSNTMALSVKTT